MAETSKCLGGTDIADSDVTFDYTCQPCVADNKTIEAVGFCVNCSEFLCDECFRYHLKPSLTRQHKLLDIEEAKKDTSLSSCLDIEEAKRDTSPSGCLDICTEKCPQHSGEVIKYFCLDHDCLGCGICITLDHRNCQGVQYIPKIAEGAAYGEDYINLISQLDMVLWQTKIIADTSRGNKFKSQDSFDKVLDQVKRVRKEVNQVLDKLEKDIETEAEQTKTMDMHKMDEHINLCDTIHSQIDKLTSKLESMKQKGQHCNLFAAMKDGEITMRSVVQPLENVSKANSVSDYLFQPSRQLEMFLKNRDSLGQICKIDTIKNKAIKVGEIHMKTRNDQETCDITGMAMISSGRMLVTDNCNEKIKLIDLDQFKVMSQYQLPHRPWGITATDENDEVAVTLPVSCEIFLLRLEDGKLYKHKQVKTTGECYGVACIKDRLFVSLTSPERLEIIDKQGNVLQTIINNKTLAVDQATDIIYEPDCDNEEQFFKDVRSIAVDQATGTIYVPDCGKNTVTRLALSSQVQGIYEDTQLKGAVCIAVDKRGTVYVCGQNSNNIHQITPDCKQIRILLTKRDGLASPSSLCYDGNKDCLYVGQDKLLVFQFS